MNADNQTVIRSIVTLLAVFNQLAVSFGWYGEIIDENIILQAVTAIATLGSVIWSWWKNNSFTAQAVKADKYLKELKTSTTDSQETENTKDTK